MSDVSWAWILKLLSNHKSKKKRLCGEEEVEREREGERERERQAERKWDFHRSKLPLYQQTGGNVPDRELRVRRR